MAKKLLEKHEDELDDELKEDTIACIIHNCPDDELPEITGYLKQYRNSIHPEESKPSVSDAFDDYPDPNYTSLTDFQYYFNHKSIEDQKHFNIELSTNQFKIFQALNNVNVEEVTRTKELREIYEAILYLKEQEIPSNVIVRLQKKHFQKIAARSYSRRVKKEFSEDREKEEEMENYGEDKDDNDDNGEGREGTSEIKKVKKEENTFAANVKKEVDEFQMALEKIIIDCDRERFFEDATYREDTLIGLAM